MHELEFLSMHKYLSDCHMHVHSPNTALSKHQKKQTQTVTSNFFSDTMQIVVGKQAEKNNSKMRK